MARTISDAATEICSLRHGIENAAWEEARGKLMAYLRLRGSCVGGDQEEYDALKDEIEKFIERIDEDDIYSPSHDEITRLREENARLHKQAEMNGRLLTENAELREENARLRAALKPFAEMALQKNMKEYDEAPDECVMTAGSWGNQPLLTFRLGDLRAALAAIKETEND